MSIKIIREAYAISTGQIGDEFELGSDPETKKPVLVDSLEDACTIARTVSDEAQVPMRVLKLSEVVFMQPRRKLDPETAS
jgi:hypothetical protein